MDFKSFSPQTVLLTVLLPCFLTNSTHSKAFIRAHRGERWMWVWVCLESVGLGRPAASVVFLEEDVR